MDITTSSSSAHGDSFAKVALPVPVGTAFTYEIPQDLRSKVFVGCRVEVPFGRRILSGIVVQLSSASDIARTRAVRGIYETYLPAELLRLTEWIASYYGCSVGEAAQSVLPPVLRRSRRRIRMTGTVSLKQTGEVLEDPSPKLKRARRQLELVRRLQRAGGRAAVGTVLGEWGFSPVQLRRLLEKEIVELDSSQKVSHLESIEEEVGRLNPDQQRAFEKIVGAISSREFRPVLLRGVTGSGKTELYLRATRFALSEGGGCIVLVPEIGLLPQAIVRYQRVFGDQLAVLHSRLTGTERFDIWRRVERGECRVVLGPRSAIFSPVRNLRLIVVDEEQDDSYKQEDKPRYHARSVALMRGKHENVTVLLGCSCRNASGEPRFPVFTSSICVQRRRRVVSSPLICWSGWNQTWRRGG
jgi:primosomal protein N' (replication factor Y)